MDPMSAFFNGFRNGSGIIRDKRRDDRESEYHDLRMDDYRRKLDREREQDKARGMKRETAARILRAESGQVRGEDVAAVDPGAGMAVGDLFAQYDAIAQSGQVAPEMVEPIQAATGAMAVKGIMQPTVAGIRAQVPAAQKLKQSLDGLSSRFDTLKGKKVAVTAEQDPELFAAFAQAFPGVTNGSKVYKGGTARPVEFYVDASSAERLADATVYTVLEGEDENGRRYRAPLSKFRGNAADEPLAGARVGELYAQADFADKAGRAYLASLAEVDDETAQQVLDRYRTQGESLWKAQQQAAQVEKMLADPSVAQVFKEDDAGSLATALAGVKTGVVEPSALVNLVVKKAEENYKQKKDEASAQASLALTLPLMEGLGGRTGQMAATLKAKMAAGGYASAKDVMADNKWLFEAAVKGDQEDRKSENTLERQLTRLEMARGGAGGGGSGGYAGKLPAEAQLIEYYKSQGKTFEEAMALAKQAKENPRVWMADYYRDLAKADMENVRTYGADPTPPEDLLRQAKEAAAMLFGEQQKRPTGGGMEMMPSHGPGTATGGAQAGPVPLDKATALQILQEAGGDKTKARAIALERGFAL